MTIKHIPYFIPSSVTPWSKTNQSTRSMTSASAIWHPYSREASPYQPGKSPFLALVGPCLHAHGSEPRPLMEPTCLLSMNDNDSSTFLLRPSIRGSPGALPAASLYYQSRIGTLVGLDDDTECNQLPVVSRLQREACLHVCWCILAKFSQISKLIYDDIEYRLVAWSMCYSYKEHQECLRLPCRLNSQLSWRFSSWTWKEASRSGNEKQVFSTVTK